MAVLSIRDFPDELLHRAKKLALDGRVSLKSVVIVALTNITEGESKVITPEDNLRSTAGSIPAPIPSSKKIEQGVYPENPNSDVEGVRGEDGNWTVTEIPRNKRRPLNPNRYCKPHHVINCLSPECSREV